MKLPDGNGIDLVIAMAREVYTREQHLKQQVQELRIEIDKAKQAREVNKITEDTG